MEKLKGKKVKVIQMAIGCDLIGSKMSLANKENSMTLCSAGVHIVSLKTKREMFIPFDNIKGLELEPELKHDDLPSVDLQGRPIKKK